MYGMQSPYSAQLRGMEDELKRQQQANAKMMPQLAQGTQYSASPYTMPEQSLYDQASASTKGLERQYANRLRMAQGMMDTEMPQGRSVGPSNIYVQNPWEQGAAALSKLTGAWLQNKTEKGVGADLSKAEAEQAKAASALQRSKDALEQRNKEEGFRLTGRGQDMSLRGTMAGITSREEEGRKDRDAQEARLRAQLASEEGQLTKKLQGETASYYDPATKSVVNYSGVEEVPDGVIPVGEVSDMIASGALKASQDPEAYLAGFDEGTIDAIQGLGSATERESMAKALTSFEGLNKAMELADVAYGAGEDWTGIGDVGTAFITSFFDEESRPAVRNVMRDWTKTDNEQSVKARIGEAFEALRRAATGANLTGVEIQLAGEYDPSAQGITEEQALDRLRLYAERVNDAMVARGLPSRDIYSYQRYTPSEESVKSGRTRAEIQSQRENNRSAADVVGSIWDDEEY